MVLSEDNYIRTLHKREPALFNASNYFVSFDLLSCTFPYLNLHTSY